jgi:alanyl-tRNA synthetase
VLGDHVKQAGSLVSHDRLRFDFTHFSPVTSEEIENIEKWVNKRIIENYDVSVDEMSMDEAINSGATALFEEKYGERVRVVSVEDVSMELCGGTHTSRSGDIGLFKILSETGIAAGVRRMEAVTGYKALLYVQERERQLAEACSLFRERPENLITRLDKHIKHSKELEKEVEKLKSKIAESKSGNIEDEIKVVNQINVLSKEVEADNQGALRELTDKLKNKIKSGIILLGAKSGDKVFLTAGVTKDLTDRFNAGKLVKECAALVGGGGGGRPDMAQAGGSDPSQLDKALELIFELVEKN